MLFLVDIPLKHPGAPRHRDADPLAHGMVYSSLREYLAEVRDGFVVVLVAAPCARIEQPATSIGMDCELTRFPRRASGSVSVDENGSCVASPMT